LRGPALHLREEKDRGVDEREDEGVEGTEGGKIGAIEALGCLKVCTDRDRASMKVKYLNVL